MLTKSFAKWQHRLDVPLQLIATVGALMPLKLFAQSSRLSVALGLCATAAVVVLDRTVKRRIQIRQAAAYAVGDGEQVSQSSQLLSLTLTAIASLCMGVFSCYLLLVVFRQI
jgi:hypothetical protein